MKSFPKPKKTKKKKLTPKKVQEYFNAAIRRRDGRCMTPFYCKGALQASHFFAVGGNGGLRFHPANCWTQCAGCHFEWHNRNPMRFFDLMRKKPEKLTWLENHRTRTIKYTQEVLQRISELCLQDRLDVLEDYICDLLEGKNAR